MGINTYQLENQPVMLIMIGVHKNNNYKSFLIRTKKYFKPLLRIIFFVIYTSKMFEFKNKNYEKNILFTNRFMLFHYS